LIRRTVTSIGLVAVATANKKIGLYDYNRRIVALTLEAGTVTHCLAYSPKGDRLLSGGDDGVVRIWDVGADSTGKEIRRFATGSKGVTALVLTPDGNQILTGGSDGVIRVWALPR
jgi:WD40 repeat protein